MACLSGLGSLLLHTVKSRSGLVLVFQHAEKKFGGSLGQKQCFGIGIPVTQHHPVLCFVFVTPSVCWQLKLPA